jgi:hypothetical protein
VKAGFAAPQRVAQGLAQVPGHEALDTQFTARDPLVVAHDRGQQLKPRAQAWSRERPQIVLRLAGAGILEVDDRLEFAAVPDLVVAVQVTVHQYPRARLRQNLVAPVAPGRDHSLLFRRYPPAEPPPQRAGGDQGIPGGNGTGQRLYPPSRLVVVQRREEPRDLPPGIIQVD